VTADTAAKIGVLYAVTAVLLVSVTGGTFTVATLYDRTSTSATISTAADFTVDLGTVGNEQMDPSVLYDEGTHSELQITYDVPDVRNVTDNESRFTFDFVDHGDPVEATDIECDSEPYERNGTCTVTFDKRDLLMETGSTGNRSFVVRGYWTHDVDFVVHGTIHVEDDGPEPTDDGMESGNTATDGGTSAGNTEADDGTTAGNTGTTAGNSGTCSGNAGNTDCSGDTMVVEHVALPTAGPGRFGAGP
jgi:hypothetical protein